MIYAIIGDLPRWFEFREMPAEFQSFRAMPRLRGERDEGQSANQAARRALAEGQSFVPAAVERLRAWRELGWQSRLLVHWRILAAKLIKSELWETLAIIGATQLVILPWIGCRFWTRFAVMAALGVTHCLLSYWFNWDFLYGIDGNWMSKAWMTGDDRGWDGGILGPLNWGVVMLGGTLAYDLVAASASRAAAIARLALWGLAFLTVGYSMSCLTRLYDLSGTELVETAPAPCPPGRGESLAGRRHRAAAGGLGSTQEVSRPYFGELSRAEPQGRRRSSRAGEEQAKIERLEGTILVLEDLRRGYPDLVAGGKPGAATLGATAGALAGRFPRGAAVRRTASGPSAD